MPKNYEITYIDGNGYQCTKQVAATSQNQAWLYFIKNREYANVLHIRCLGSVEPKKGAMNKRKVNSIMKVIAHSRNAIAQGGGYYMPSDAQTKALKALYAHAAKFIGKRDETRFNNYLYAIDNANNNVVYAICADEKQLAAIEKALALVA